MKKKNETVVGTIFQLEDICNFISITIRHRGLPKNIVLLINDGIQNIFITIFSYFFIGILHSRQFEKFLSLSLICWLREMLSVSKYKHFVQNSNEFHTKRTTKYHCHFNRLKHGHNPKQRHFFYTWFSFVVVETSSKSHKHGFSLRHLVFRVGFESSSPSLP